MTAAEAPLWAPMLVRTRPVPPRLGAGSPGAAGVRDSDPGRKKAVISTKALADRHGQAKPRELTLGFIRRCDVAGDDPAAGSFHTPRLPGSRIIRKYGVCRNESDLRSEGCCDP